MNTGGAGGNPLRALQQLAVTAVLGSDRAGGEAKSPTLLLTRAAVAGARARAGRGCAARGQDIPAPAEETRAPATLVQAALLDRLLASPDADTIDEWCTLANARGICVPPASVPALLDWWSRQSARSPAVFEAAGACGVWLASLNPAWRKPVAGSNIPADADDLWQTGKAGERSALLMTVRRYDPARAVQMVRATWDTDGADERRRFIEILGTEISPADEPFFESALSDRSKVVRLQAATALARLAGSALRTRMTERAATFLIVDQGKAASVGGGKRARAGISLEPPKAFDKSWERDAVEENPAAGKGKRAHWMMQILTSTNLSTWIAPTALSPADFLDTIKKDEFFPDALRGMTLSLAGCPAQPDSAAWANAIVEASTGKDADDLRELSLVWAAQPVETSESLRLLFIEAAKAGAKGPRAWDVLVSDERPWTSQFSHRAIALLGETKPKKNDFWHLWEPIERASKLLDPRAADAFDQVIVGMFPDGLTDSLRKSVERIRLRAEMHKEFQS